MLFSRMSVVLIAGMLVVQVAVVRADLLKIDINQAGAGATENGFNAFDIPVAAPADITNAYGSYTVQVQIAAVGNAGGAYNRGGLPDTTPLKDLYNDFAYYNKGDVAPIDVTIGGLVAGQSYAVKLYSFDYENNNKNVTATFTPFGGTGGSAVSVSYNTSVAPTTADQYATTATWTANSLGQIGFEGVAFVEVDGTSASWTRLNGFTVSSVPEPSSILLSAMGIVGLLAFAWRKRK